MSIEGDFIKTADIPEIFYDTSRHRYFYQTENGDYCPQGADSMANTLKLYGMSTKQSHTQMSSAHEYLYRIQNSHSISWVGSLAGYFKGRHRIQGKYVLVDDEPNIIQPDKRVDFTDLKNLIAGMMPDRTERQIFYAWLKVGYEALRDQTQRPGQCLAMSGPPNCGKTLMVHVIKAVLGGRFSKPKQFLSGETTFNSDLVGTELLVMDDEDCSKKMVDRTRLGQVIKNCCVSASQRVHSKGRDAFMAPLFWRILICTNVTDDDLNVLPPLVPGVKDKIINLKVQQPKIPFPGPEDYNKRPAYLVSQLPGLLHWLTNWEIPRSIQSHRFGVIEYHNEFIERTLWTTSDEAQLLDIIRQWDPYDEDGVWVGTAVEFKNQVLAYDEYRQSARELIGWKGAANRLLGNLCDILPRRFFRSRNPEGSWTFEIHKEDLKRRGAGDEAA